MLLASNGGGGALYVLNTLAPVFAIIALGAVLRKIHFLSADLTAGINRLAYWVGLPCLLFVSLATAPPLGDQPEAARVLGVVLGVTLLLALAAMVVAWLLRLPGASVGTFMQAAFRGNLVYVGLAVIKNAFPAVEGQPSPQTALAVLAVGPLVVVYNILAVAALMAGQHRFSWSAIGRMLRGMATNPLLIACVAGVAYSAIAAQVAPDQPPPLRLPALARRTLETAGQFALPVALLAIGSVVVSTPIRGRLGPVASAVALKLAAGPLLAAGGAMLLGLTPQATAAVLILMACPTAAVSAVLCDQLGGDVPLAAGAVVASTLLSVVSLAIVVAVI